jgi:hypothetical protein
LNNETGAQKKKRGKKLQWRGGGGRGERWPHTRRRERGEEGENKISPPLPQTEPHRGGGETSLSRWKKPNEKEVFSQEREESFSGGKKNCIIEFVIDHY